MTPMLESALAHIASDEDTEDDLYCLDCGLMRCACEMNAEAEDEVSA